MSNAPMPIEGERERLLHFALDYAQRGFPVFPCSPLNKAPFPKPDTDPVTGEEIERTGGLYKATLDPEQIKRWWREWPNAMIGIPTGRRSGVFAIDPDAPKRDRDADGRASWRNLQAKHDRCPATHTHNTPGGGQHIVFRWRADKPVTNKEGKLKGLGINVRGDGGYIIAPPSMAGSGKRYEYAEPLDAFNFADAPDWLYDLILAKPSRQSLSGRRQRFGNRAPVACTRMLPLPWTANCTASRLPIPASETTF